MKTLHILVTSALALGAVAVANPANAYWGHLIAQNDMTATPATPSGAGSELGVARSSGVPVNSTMARSGQDLASISGSGSENRAAIASLAAGGTTTQVAGAEPANGGALR